METAGIKII